MKNKIITVLAMVMIMMLCMSMSVCFAAPDASADSAAVPDAVQEAPAQAETKTADKAPAEVTVPAESDLVIKSASIDAKTGILDIVVANKAAYEVKEAFIILTFANSHDEFVTEQSSQKVYPQGGSMGNPNSFAVQATDISAGGEKEISLKVALSEESKKSTPILNCEIQHIADMTAIDTVNGYEIKTSTFENILESAKGSKAEAIKNFLRQTGFSMTDWKSLLMIIISCILFYLAIVKKFEPLLLLPIAFGMLLTNLMGSEVFHEQLFQGGHVHWDLFGAANAITPGLIDVLYLGVKLGIYPCLIFLGVGAMTDFGPLIANPKSLLLGAAAQVGIFATFIGAYYLGFTPAEAGSIGIIGGADGPTAIFVTSKLAPHLLGPIAVAAYSYMALVPVIQPPIMKLLTTKSERQIVMKELRPVSQKEKIIFPIVVSIFVALLVPSAAPLVGCLMLGNLLKESGVCERLSKTVQNELMNIVTIFLGVSVGATATAGTFLSLQTIKIIVMGVVAFGVATACGVLLAKFMNLFLKNKINPLIGSAGVSAVPMAARVSQKVGQEENPGNFLLMHAMGPNVAGVIGSAIAAGALIAMLAK